MTGDGAAQVAPATLDAISKVLEVLMAASAKQPASESTPSAPSPRATTSSAAGAAQRGAAQQSYRQPSSTEMAQRGTAEPSYRQPSSAEMAQRGTTEPSYRQPSSAEMAHRGTTDPSYRQPSSTEMAQRGTAELSYRQPGSVRPVSAEQKYRQFGSAETVQRGAAEQRYGQPSSEPAPEPSKKSFLKVIDHQFQSAGRSSDALDSPDFGRQLPAGRRDEPMSRGLAEQLDDRRRMSSADYHRGRVLEDVRQADLHRHLDDDRFGSRSAGADRRTVGDVRDAGRHYGGARRGSEFWNEMSAYCAAYESRLGRADGAAELPRRPPAADYVDEMERRRATDYADEPYRRRVRESAMSERVTADEADRRYRLLADSWREGDVQRSRADDYARYRPGPRDADYEAVAAPRARTSALDSKDYYNPSTGPSSRQ